MKPGMQPVTRAKEAADSPRGGLQISLAARTEAAHWETADRGVAGQAGAQREHTGVPCDQRRRIRCLDAIERAMCGSGRRKVGGAAENGGGQRMERNSAGPRRFELLFDGFCTAPAVSGAGGASYGRARAWGVSGAPSRANMTDFGRRGGPLDPSRSGGGRMKDSAVDGGAGGTPRRGRREKFGGAGDGLKGAGAVECVFGVDSVGGGRKAGAEHLRRQAGPHTSARRHEVVICIAFGLRGGQRGSCPDQLGSYLPVAVKLSATFTISFGSDLLK
ncbi:hypothetical protein DFH09DRAFT_1090889 [Mycena vulgaris]|nr:hypothetical protein DFH09DRAFT_1090889 [Mycena vulgaris]